MAHYERSLSTQTNDLDKATDYLRLLLNGERKWREFREIIWSKSVDCFTSQKDTSHRLCMHHIALFLDAPADVVEKEREKMQMQQQALDKLKEQAQRIKEI